MNFAICTDNTLRANQGHAVIIHIGVRVNFRQANGYEAVIAGSELLKAMGSGARDRFNMRSNFSARFPAVASGCHFWQDDQACFMLGRFFDQAQKVGHILLFLAKCWFILDCCNPVPVGEGYRCAHWCSSMLSTEGNSFSYNYVWYDQYMLAMLEDVKTIHPDSIIVKGESDVIYISSMANLPIL